MTGSDKTLVIGLAGVTWPDLMARAGEGQLPGLAQMLRRAALWRMADDAEGNAAAAWASLSTGVLGHQHGIVGPEEARAGGLRPVGRSGWGYPPVWQRLAEAGVDTLSVGWPFTRAGASWPGVHVDDRLGQASGRDWDHWLSPRGVAPAEWRERLADIRVHPTDITADMLAPFVPALGSVDQRTDRSLVDLAMMIARLSTHHAARHLLLGEAPWQAAFVFHQWIAAVQERFGGASTPYDTVVDAAWTLLDTIVPATAASVPADTQVVLVSPGWRGQRGFLAAIGPGLAPGARPELARGMDLVPTLLARHGLVDPLLGGRALWGGDAPLRALPPLPDRGTRATPDRAALDRVAGFGHAPPRPPAGWAARRLVELARQALPHDADAADRFARAALAEDGDEPAALGLVAAAAVARDRFEELPALADRVAAVAPGHVWEDLIRGGFHAAQGDAGAARVHLDRVEKSGGRPERMRAGAAWLMLDRPADAQRVFEAVLADAPDDVAALLGLGVALSAIAPGRAEPVLRRCLSLDPARADTRQALGEVLRRIGRTREADQIAAGRAPER